VTEVLEALGVGTYDAWSLLAGPDKVSAVNLPNDEDTSYIRAAYINTRQSFTLEASAIPAGSTINSVTVLCRADTIEYPAGNFLGSFLRLSGTNNDGPANPVVYGSWTDFSDTLTRPGGGSWTLSDLASLEIGVIIAVDNKFCRVTTLYAIIDYTPGGGPTPTGAMLLLF